jgi:hypothetical protein
MLHSYDHQSQRVTLRCEAAKRPSLEGPVPCPSSFEAREERGRLRMTD